MGAISSSKWAPFNRAARAVSPGIPCRWVMEAVFFLQSGDNRCIPFGWQMPAIFSFLTHIFPNTNRCNGIEMRAVPWRRIAADAFIFHVLICIYFYIYLMTCHKPAVCSGREWQLTNSCRSPSVITEGNYWGYYPRLAALRQWVATRSVTASLSYMQIMYENSLLQEWRSSLYISVSVSQKKSEIQIQTKRKELHTTRSTHDYSWTTHDYSWTCWP